MDFRVVMQE